MKEIVIYHAGCFDGFCAAWLMRLAYPGATFLPARYGDTPPDVKGASVRVVDFSYPRDVLAKMIADAGGNLVVLDHHKTAEADLSGPELADHCIFDMGKSGGRLAWEYLWDNALLPPGFSRGRNYSSGNAPWLVHYTEDRDLWRHELPSTREINAALRSYPMDFALWDGWAHWQYHRSEGYHAPGLYLQEFAKEGEAILRNETQVVATHVRNAREIDMDGHRVLCVNATTLVSEIGEQLARDRPFGVTYFDLADGKRAYSLRSRDGGIDVSEVAKRRGGGGHRGAAGFTGLQGDIGL